MSKSTHTSPVSTAPSAENFGASMLTSRRKFLLGSAAMGAMSLLSACKNVENQENAKNAKFNLFITEPVSIDPYNDQDVYGSVVVYQLFDTLTVFDFSKEELIPLAAESWESNDTGTEFTFKIKKGNKFHNGEEVTAQSFKRAWERVVNPKTGNTPSSVAYNFSWISGYDEVISGAAEEMKGISCPDDYTLKVELARPNADFPFVCSLGCASPVPAAALENFDSFFKAPIGNGAYKMDGERGTDRISIVRNEDYKNGPVAKLAGINFHIFKDVDTAYREFQAGNLDLCEVPPAQLSEAIEAYGKSEDGYTILPKKQVLNGAQPSIYFLTVNMTDPVMQDRDLRHAMSLAINRQAICDTLFNGAREAAGTVVAPGVKGFKANTWQDARYDPDAARALLDKKYPTDANGKRDISITLSYNLDGAHKQIMEAVAADLQAVGISVQSDTMDFPTLLKHYDEKQFQVGRLGWMSSYPTIGSILYPLFYTGNGDNTAHYSNLAYDALINKAYATTDEQQRLEIFHEAEQILAEDMPAIPIMYYRASKVGSARVKYAYVGPMEYNKTTDWELS